MAGLYGNGVELTEKMLDFLWGRQKVTLSNISNNDTPGYKSRYITFEEELQTRIQKASQTGRPRTSVSQAIDSARVRVHTTRNESTRLDGNNVDMDQEQVDLVRNAYEYQYMLSSINNDFKRLQNAAKAF
ncbi:MAG: flagellar basal body rod protein FlgB [Lachnospiraceae bacterium]|nr:flagellar basal body rod protein FlgB [Lachnospiraceae bacterium]